MRRLTSMLLVMIGLGWSADVSGQDAPDPETVTQAEELYLEAVEAFKAGDSERAASLFHQSWELVPKPELLYNEAIAWSDAGDIRRAADVSRQAAGADLPPKMRTKNAARLRAWSIHLDAVAVVQASEVEEEPVTPTETLARESTEPPEESSPDPEQEDAPRRSSGRTLGVVLGATGLAAVAASGIISWQIQQTGRRLDEAVRREDRAAYDAFLRQGERLQMIGIATLVSGVAVAGTGAVVWLVSGPSEQQRVSFGLGPSSVTAEVRF